MKNKNNIFTIKNIVMFIIIFLIIRSQVYNNNIYGEQEAVNYIKMILYYIKSNNKYNYNYILSDKYNIIQNNRLNIYFYIKKTVSFCNKKNLCLLLQKYNENNICPKTYTFPEEYYKYEKECINKKMILKSNTNRQEGLFITSNIQSKNFISDEHMIIGQEYLSDCLRYKHHKLTFRIYLIVTCHKNNINTYIYNDGLVYYNNNDDVDISSFYGSYDLYDQNYPVTITKLENEMGIKIMNKIVIKIKEFTDIIKKEQSSYYLNDKNYYNEVFGVDFHITNKFEVFMLEVNKTPGMDPYCTRDKNLRINMLKSYIDIINNKKNDKIIKT